MMISVIHLLLSRFCSDKGITFRIVMAKDGQKALDLLAQDPEVDLVLMDIMMPILDGYELSADPHEAKVQEFADPGADGQSDERGPGEVFGGRS